MNNDVRDTIQEFKYEIVKFIKSHESDIDNFSVKKVLADISDTFYQLGYVEGFTISYYLFSLISNKWLERGLNPLSALTSVPQFFGSCLDDDIINKLEIPSCINRIENYAFYDCENLTSIMIPDNVKSIGSWAFIGCNLSKVSVPISCRWSSRAFSDGTTVVERV